MRTDQVSFVVDWMFRYSVLLKAGKILMDLVLLERKMHEQGQTCQRPRDLKGLFCRAYAVRSDLRRWVIQGCLYHKLLPVHAWITPEGCNDGCIGNSPGSSQMATLVTK